MATQPALLSFYVVDDLGVKAGMPFYVNYSDAQTGAQTATEALALGTLINALTGCQVIEVSCFQLVTLPGTWRSAPVAGSRASLGATLQFNVTGTSNVYGVVVPAILPAKISGYRLNTGDSDVAALITHLTSSGGPYVYTNKEGQSLASFAASFLGTRKPAPYIRRALARGRP